MKKVLIFGAAGFVGRYLIDEFFHNGYEVFASDIVPNYENDHCHYVPSDITDAESVAKVVESAKPDYIVNLAAISSVGLSWKIPAKTFQVNVGGTINVLEALVKNELRAKVLIVGSSEEYVQLDRPLKPDDKVNANNPYGISKVSQEMIADLYASRYGLKILKTRSFNHTGPGQKDDFVIPSFCKQVAEIIDSGKPGEIHVGNLSAIRDFSDVRDVVANYRFILENYDEGTFNVGSGEAKSIEEILHLIISYSDQPIKIVVDPERVRPVDTPFICCDPDSIPLKPQHKLESTIESLINFYRHLD